MSYYWETKDFVLAGLIILYIIICYLFSRIGESREIGARKLFWISLFLTPIFGYAVWANSSHKKLNLYTEDRYKCTTCGYVFTEPLDHCPICAKEGKTSEVKIIEMYMT